jgi:hypothetical protein
MAKASNAQARRSKPIDFSKIHKCKIHPGIGIARVGNSPDQYFIGPEAPRHPAEITAPEGSFKDADGHVKRQAARFRIYAYDRKGRNLGELPIASEAGKDYRRAARVEWQVHLSNKKGAWYKFHTRFEKDPEEIRNADIRVPAGRDPDTRLELVIDPRPRCIGGEGAPPKRPGIPHSLKFDTGKFRDTTVPLGELRVDPAGRLLVLGGLGKSESTKLDNPIGSNVCDVDYWANNDFWYDDISDGPVTATVTLPSGKQVAIDNPQDSAWVVVAPPKYAPGIEPIVTLYDVMREVALDQGWIKDPPDVTFYRDIYPTLRRAAETSWVNREARRGHGFDKRGDFRTSPGTPAEAAAADDGVPKAKVNRALLASDVVTTPGDDKVRRRIFARLRNPQANNTDKVEQAKARYMPPLSGDAGDRTVGDPKNPEEAVEAFDTWLSILPSQYRKFKLWKDGQFTTGQRPTFPSFESIKDPDKQTEALQRAALEPCIGGAFYPGIEVPWIVLEPARYAAAFRINSKTVRPGDLTKGMCLPWQADFYDCRDSWWPAARPDDVIPEEVFEEANKAWQPGQPKLSEALEDRVKWDRGLGVTTLFRRPWGNPADAVDDPRDSERRGCDDMVHYWQELGFVLPRKTAWKGEDPAETEVVHVEMERRPHAGMDVRELFHCLLNIEENRSCLPKVQEFVDNVLKASRRLQETADSFAFMDNIRPFKYDEDVFDARMMDIYDDCADFAFTVEKERVRYDPEDIKQNPNFHTRENVIERIRQLAPFNFLDGSWLRNIHRVGPVDEVNSILFTILKEELGDGVPSQNHANIYRDLCHSFGFYPPEMTSMAFARDPVFLDCAFDSPVFQLGISEFSRRYYPEIIGMSLWLEWTVLDLHRIAAIVERVGLSSHFYRMHIAIDNAASGHGAGIIRAVKLYLAQIRIEGGDQAVQEHWKRIWDGYVAFAHTFSIIIMQVIWIVQKPPSKQKRLEWLIAQKAPYAEYNHTRKDLAGQSLNSWFADPEAFLEALQTAGWIVPGKPDQSPFFKLLEFRGGPMYHVFTEEEIALWRDWTWEKGEERKSHRGPNLRALRDRLAGCDPAFAQDVSDDELSLWRDGANDHRLSLWLKVITAEAENGAPQGTRASAGRARLNAISGSMQFRFQTWVGWSMIRAVTYIAAQRREAVEGLTFTLPRPDTGERLSLLRWFDLIRAESNSARPARALLQSLARALKAQDGLFEELFGAQGLLYYAFNTGIPGNDGRCGLETVEVWFRIKCPVPDPAEGPVRPLRLDASLYEEETHPTGLAMGFGTVH